MAKIATLEHILIPSLEFTLWINGWGAQPHKDIGHPLSYGSYIIVLKN